MMTSSQARVVDPVLTTHAQGYKQPKYVGHLLFPRVDVLTRGGKVIEFGKEAFRKYNARRAPGADAKEITLGYEGKPYELFQDSLDAKVPREHLDEANEVPKIDLGIRAVNVVMNALTLAVEIEQAELATDPNSYGATHKITLAGATKWTDAGSDPIKVISDGMAVVQSSTGSDPNVMILGPGPYRALKEHPKVLERFKGVSADSVTPEMLARLLDLETVAVGKAVVADDDTDAFTSVWGAHAVLAYVPPVPPGYGANVPEEPSFGYTYTLKGHPYVEQPYWRQKQRSWLYGVTYERRPVLTGITAGYFIQDAV